MKVLTSLNHTGGRNIPTDAANLTTLGENFVLDLVMYTNLWTPPFSNNELQINTKIDEYSKISLLRQIRLSWP